MKTELLFLFLAGSLKISSQCVINNNNAFSFIVSDVPYEIIKEKKTWLDAASCAVSRGGKLVEINSKPEQDTIFYYVNHAGINAANTVAPDGGGASYVWLGGNDIATEGKWIWDGVNAGSTNQFWQGVANGSAVGSSFTNWGDEPDNFGNQDALGLAITDWPLGVAGQWNDVKETNQLYYVIEFPKIVTTSLKEFENRGISFYPNPAGNFVNLEVTNGIREYIIRNSLGAVIKKGNVSSNETLIDLSDLPTGIYFLSSGTEFSRLVKTE